jgi:hypothetical protein
MEKTIYISLITLKTWNSIWRASLPLQKLFLFVSDVLIENPMYDMILNPITLLVESLWIKQECLVAIK